MDESRRDPHLSIVVPVYNNAATLDALIDRLVAAVEPLGLTFELILVDDGSRDESLAILMHRQARDRRIRALALTRNFGSQAAVCAGIEHMRGEVGVCMDADLENCPEDIPRFLEALETGCDLICGYRVHRNAPWLTRRLPSALMNLYVRRRTGTRVRDIGCGMRAFRRSLVRDLASAGEARRLLTPLLLQLAVRVGEIPLSEGVGRRSTGHSFFSLLGIAVDYLLLTHGRPFLITAGISIATTILSAVWLLAGDRGPALSLFVAGILGTWISVAGDYCQHLYRIAQKAPFYSLRSSVAAPATSMPVARPHRVGE